MRMGESRVQLNILNLEHASGMTEITNTGLSCQTLCLAILFLCPLCL